jgi:hypothetical protein
VRFPRLEVTIALAVFVQPFLYAQSTVTEADDAYRLKYWQGTSHEDAYNEWWYFNLYDTNNAIQGVFSYQVADPLNLTGEGVADMTA